MMFRKHIFQPGGAKTEGEIPGTSKQYSFGLKYMMVRSRFRRKPKHGDSTCTAVSAHLSDTTAKRRGIAKLPWGQFRKVAKLHAVDVIGRRLQHFGPPRTKCHKGMTSRRKDADKGNRPRYAPTRLRAPLQNSHRRTKYNQRGCQGTHKEARRSKAPRKINKKRQARVP